MRRLGYAVVDRVIERITGLGNRPAWQGGSRSQFEQALREPAPESGRDFDGLMDRLYRHVLPFAAQVDHPRFLAFVPGCPTWPGILADWIATAHNIFQGTWLGSSGPSALELIVLDWLKEWIGFPATASGLLLSGGSSANLIALACARAQRDAQDYGRAVLYWSSESHSSVAKAARILGFPPDRVRVLPADAQNRLPVDLLERAVAEDRARGLVPLVVVANAGTTSTGAVDPLPEIARLARAQSLWLHVDAAYGGFAALTERGRHWLRGIEDADSITLDPHKWFYQPFEVGCLLVRDARLDRAFHSMPDYLQDTAIAGREVNFADRGYQLTRSARAIKIWLSVQYFGLESFRAAIDQSLDLAAYSERRLQSLEQFEILSGVHLGIVCFRRRAAGADEAELENLNVALTRQLADSGVGMISSTRVRGHYALRFCIMNYRTARADVDRVIDFLAEAQPTTRALNQE
jgi:glutamate/tyrosine decarboxylase-like PLP-dependent enzyme